MKKLGDIVYQDSNIQELLDVIESIDNKTKAVVLKAISQKLTEQGKAQSINAVKQIIASGDPAIRKWISEAIPKSYAEGLNFSDYEFNSIKLRPSVAQDALNNIAKKTGISNQVKNINTSTIYRWGDLQEKIGKAVNYDPKIMGEVRSQVIKDWIKYNTSSKVTVDSQKIGAEFQNTKLRITPEDIKIARDLSIHSGSINALLSDTYLDFANGMNGLVRGAEQKLNEAMKQQMRAKILASQVTGQSVDKVKKEITKLLGDQGFSVLTDRGGHTWTLRRYSEMLARTHVIKASNEALVNRAGQFGVDIVQISTHSGACSLCTPYEGKLYSLSGTSETYPALSVSLPIHPNCRHVLLMRPDLI